MNKCFYIRDLNAVAAGGDRVDCHFPQYAAILDAHGLDGNGTVTAERVRPSVEHGVEIADTGHQTRLTGDAWAKNREGEGIVGNGKRHAAANQRRHNGRWNDVSQKFDSCLSNPAGKRECPNNGHAHVVVAQNFEDGAQQRRTLRQPADGVNNTHAQQAEVGGQRSDELIFAAVRHNQGPRRLSRD